MVHITCNLIELCAFKIENRKTYFLLLHRTKKEKLYPNIWQMITGSIKKNEKAVDAAIRELKEETGLKPLHLWLVPLTFSFFNSQKDSLILSPFFAAQVKCVDSIDLSREHDDYGWFTINKAREKLILPSWKKGIKIVYDYIVRNREVNGFSKII